MVQLMPLHPQTPSSLASFKSRLVLPFWYRLAQVILEKRRLNGCSIISRPILHCEPARQRGLFSRSPFFGRKVQFSFRTVRCSRRVIRVLTRLVVCCCADDESAARKAGR